MTVAPRDRLVTLPDGVPGLTLGWQLQAAARSPSSPAAIRDELKRRKTQGR